MSTFVRVVDTGRLAAAAKSRGMSVAAVSRQLSSLEKELGTTLIARSTRQLSVTEPGRKWYRYCVNALRDLEAVRADISEPTEVRGVVTVSSPASVGLSLLVPCFDRLTRTHPKLAIELRLEDHAVSLLSDGADIAFRVGLPLPDSTSIVANRLFSFRRALVASRSYLRAHGTPQHPDDLNNHALLVHTRASTSFTRWSFTKGERTVEVEPRSRLQSTSPLALRDWARQGAGIALIPDWFTDDLHRVMTDWLTPEITAYALFRAESRGAPRMRVVLEALSRMRPPLPRAASAPTRRSDVLPRR